MATLNNATKRIIFTVLGILAFFFLLAFIIKYFGKNPWIPVPPIYSEGEARTYCIELATALQSLSYFHLIVAWVFIIAGGLSAFIGSLLGSNGLQKNDTTILNFVKGFRGLLLVVAGGVLTTVGLHFMDRSAAATKAGAVATEAIIMLDEKPREAYEICVEAKSTWLAGRMDDGRLQQLISKLDASASNKNNNETEDADKQENKPTDSDENQNENED